MIKVIKGKKVVAVIAVIAIIITICVAGVCYAYSTAWAISPNAQYTVVVDAGHGGIDGGVVGSSGVKESDINLKMAKILRQKLQSRGFSVVMTREDENSLSNIKRIDMQARKDKIIKANPIVVISLHVNRFIADKSRRGAQVFYDDTGVGKEFADIMQQAINQNINSKYCGRSNYEAIDGDLFITKCVKVPSLIIECGFISNPEDEKLLLSKEYCNDLCENIASVLETSVGA